MKKRNDLLELHETVKAIKTVILKNRYLATRKANFEHIRTMGCESKSPVVN